MVSAASAEGTGDAPSIARKILASTAAAIPYLSDHVDDFMARMIGAWALDGCRHEVGEALKNGAMQQQGTTGLPLFDQAAYVPEVSGFRRNGSMVLLFWRSAIAFKRQKAAQVTAEAERMEAFERSHLAIWEQHPNWSAERVEREGRRKRAKAA